jgi:hypothetical protein
MKGGGGGGLGNGAVGTTRRDTPFTLCCNLFRCGPTSLTACPVASLPFTGAGLHAS